MKENEIKLYTVKQLAEILQVTADYVYLMTRRREIPYIDISRGKKKVYRFDLNSVMKSIEKQKR